MRRVKIVHRTYYNFSSPVQLGAHRMHLRPRAGHEMRIESSTLEISPPATVRWLRDVYDNSVAIATFDSTTAQLAILSEVIVQHYDERPLDFVVSDYAVQYPFAYESEDGANLQSFLVSQASDGLSSLNEWIRQFWKPGDSMQTYTLLQNLNTGIHQAFRYQSREEPGVQSAAETLRTRSGSCRDFANLLMEAARSLGLAARFVSGYLNAPTSNWDLGATHAWAEVYLPGAGWKGFDPTIGELVSTKHIPVAVARWPESVPPVSGSFTGPPGATLQVGVWVSEL
jgi:transglutaminase-like putative cysteine protease